MVSLSFTVLFAILSYIIMHMDTTVFDDGIYNWFSSWWSTSLNPVMRAFTFLADTKTSFIFTVVGLCFFAYKKLYKYSFLLTTSMGGGVVITYILKTTIARERPGEIAHMNIWGLFTDRISYSFPSGHAVKGLLFFGVLIYAIYFEMEKGKLRNWLIGAFSATTALIGVGQILLDRHFTSDILGGYLVGMAWLTFCMAINEPVADFIWEKCPEGARSKIQRSLGGING